MTYQLGIDIGGTFTDIFVLNEEAGEINQEKVSTTPKNFAQGVLNGIETVFEKHGITADEVSYLSHGTTVATNALLEREGVKTGMITTDGFRDVTAIGREKRSQVYNHSPPKTPTFTERRNRLGVEERVTHRGEVATPLDQRAVEEAVTELEERGVESIAVALINAYQNDVHERQIEEIIADRMDASVSISSEVMPEIREYERFFSTVINAYISPIVTEYVDRLRGRIDDLGIDAPLHVMQANGGLLPPESVADRSLRLINSGPAAGITGARQFGRASGIHNVITLDMGGTSADAGLIRDGEIETTTESEINEIPLMFPQIDVRTVGAGGGSIAWLDRADVLKVGPKSAGAQPGPACYDRGGTEPTVTDAALLLGYLNPDYFLGGDMPLNPDRAEAALDPLAETLDQDTVHLADGILDIVTTNMAGTIRTVSVEKGYDPRGFALACYGGAGPLFVTRLAREFGIERAFIPPAPGVLSASGLLSADLRFDFASSRPLVLGDASPDKVAETYNELENRAQSTVDFDEFTVRRSADIRYAGQTSEINIPVPAGEITIEVLGEIADTFHNEYEAIYDHFHENEAVEVVTWRLHLIKETADVTGQISQTADNEGDAIKDSRGVFVDGEFRELTVYDRYMLPPGSEFEAPAIIEEREATTVVSTESHVRVDENWNLVVDIEP